MQTANAALAVARQQSAEAVRARIDAAVPAISVHMDTEVDWPPYEPSNFLGGHPNQLPAQLADPMLMPRNRDRRIMVRAGVRVTNDSDRHVRVNVDGLLAKADGVTVIRSPCSLGPGEELAAWCAATHSLGEWIEVYKARAAGQAGDEVVATVTYLDPADTGASDHWDLVIGGVPIEPVPDLDSGWQFIPAPRPAPGEIGAMATSPVVLRHRRYYLSKSRNEELSYD